MDESVDRPSRPGMSRPLSSSNNNSSQGNMTVSPYIRPSTIPCPLLLSLTAPYTLNKILTSLKP